MALRDAARSCPPETATALIVYALELEEKSGRAGGCPDPEEKAAWRAVQRWLKAWRGGALGQAGPAAPKGSGRVAAQGPWGETDQVGERSSIRAAMAPRERKAGSPTDVVVAHPRHPERRLAGPRREPRRCAQR